MQEEVWKDIEGYEGLYQVSTLGRVKSLARERVSKDKILKSSGVRYKLVCLYKSGIVKYVKVHRLVANAFISNPENKPQVNHKDGNKFNNSVSNLEWATSKENCIHAVQTGLSVVPKGEKSHLFGIGTRSKIVLDLATGIFYNSAKEASFLLGLNHSVTRSMLNGRLRNKTSLIYA